MKKKFLCPYCFSVSLMSEIQFRCQNPSPDKCKSEPDTIYAEHRGKAVVPMKIVFKNKGKANAKKANCPACNESSTDRVCPECHSTLPYTIGEFEDFTFSIIGAKASGKSHYIAVLINELKKNIGRLFSSDLQAVDDDTINKYKNNFYNHIFKKHETIPETKSAKTNRDVRTPMVYTLKMRGNSWFKKNYIKEVVTISFFDTAGEDLDSKDVMSTTYKYIYHSKGIILLIDPLQIGDLRNEARSKDIKLPDEFTNPVDIITRVAAIIREHNDIPINRQIDIPIAVVFTKIDVLNVIDESTYINSSFARPSGHKGFFNRREAQSIHTEIEGFLSEWDGTELLNNLNSDFKNYCFFGLSALGSNPGNQTSATAKIPRLRPHRVADPFLWLLKYNKLISEK